MTSHGIHYVTAIAGDVRRNVAFYTHDLGLRLVKKTVNFDDPGTTTPITATRPTRRARS
jgi:glyoxalase family protein